MKIEKNIPIHKQRRKSKYGVIAREMQDGDSVLCENKGEEAGVRHAIYALGDGHVPVSRKQLDRTIRVWKVKNNKLWKQ